MTWYDAFSWIGNIIVWGIIIRDWRSILRRRRFRRAHGDPVLTHMVEVTGLSELQVQVAIDASMATFSQRVHEMQEHNKMQHHDEGEHE